MKDEIVRFIREYVLGRSLETDEVVYPLEGGRLQGSYTDRMFFSDLRESEQGLQFDMTTVTREKIYEVDGEGRRGAVRRDFTGTSVFHYELALRKSTGQVTGFTRGLSSTVRDHTMEAVVYGVFDVLPAGGELKWKEQQLLYRDMPSVAQAYRPVAFDSSVRFYLEEGKLRFEYVPVYFDFDPETLTRTLSKDQYPPFVSKEK